MEQNKVRTYIFYALGEIFLVVIGIMIALQVNNWNQERLAIEQQTVLLANVLEALSADSLAIEQTEDHMDLTHDVYVQLFRISKGELNPDSLRNTYLMRRSVPIRPVSVVHYPDLASQILDTDLKLRVLDYYENLNRWVFVVNNYNDFIENVMRSFMTENNFMNYGFSIESESSSYLIDDEKLVATLYNNEIQQILNEAAIRTRNTKNFYGFVMKSRDELISEIKRAMN